MNGARAAFAYTPGRSPLHRASPGASFLFVGAFAATAFVHGSPLVLAAAGVAIAVAGVAAGAGRALRATAAIAAPLIVLMMLVNALVLHRGETVLLRGWRLPVLGDTDVTLESIAAGGVIGLRVVVVLLAFALWSACVDPDRLLRALRPLARRSAMTAALIARLLPVAAADLTRLRDASRLRGPAAAPAGRAALARRLVAGSLDRSVDLAATLELRGHSLPAPPRLSPRRGRASDGPARAARRANAGLIAGAALCAAAAAAGLATGAAAFRAFPTLEVAAGAPAALVCAGIVAAAAAPWAWPALRRARGGAR